MVKRRRLIIVTDQGTAKVFGGLFDVEIENPKGYFYSDVFLFEGGTDVDPRLYGENFGNRTSFPDTQRDSRESQVFKAAQAVGAACIGICRGSQFLTVMSGGKLIQDVTGHGQSHNIYYFNDKTGELTPLRVTSTHHQMMYPWSLSNNSYDYNIIGWSAQRLSKHYLNGDNKEEVEPPVEPEIVWYPKTRSLCIQGHPEYVNHNDPFPVYCRELVRKYIFGEK